MPHPTCPCSAALDRCSRCDVLIGLPDLHLVEADVTDTAVVLDVECCDPLTGCLECGVIPTGHGRVTVSLIDAPFAGRPTRLRWRKHRWICREPACPVVTFTEQNPDVAAPRSLLTRRAVSWAIRQLRYENASIQGLARQLARPGTPCGPRSAHCSLLLRMIRSASRTSRSLASMNTSGTTPILADADRRS